MGPSQANMHDTCVEPDSMQIVYQQSKETIKIVESIDSKSKTSLTRLVLVHATAKLRKEDCFCDATNLQTIEAMQQVSKSLTKIVDQRVARFTST